MGFRDHAGLDYKGTNYEMFSKLRFRAWGGPPYDPLPVFEYDYWIFFIPCFFFHFETACL
ncbi:hypothetical protein ANCCAN_27917 [Ancylostoma caninum]|uniref:Phospholipase B-like n=1 Tax=Ancylostoma caninum TaxID=29170 RepID=A0A368F844_ANCCA|nr:hypothetical protein ANCCAN_27917 [Ancylostoma caninum]